MVESVALRPIAPRPTERVGHRSVTSLILCSNAERLAYVSPQYEFTPVKCRRVLLWRGTLILIKRWRHRELKERTPRTSWEAMHVGKKGRRTVSELPDPHEWDFREINYDEAHVAERYEYAREIPELLKAHAKWRSIPLKHCFRCSSDSGLTSEWLEKTIGDVIAAVWTQKVPQRALDGVCVSRPGALSRALTASALMEFHEFPQPYLSIPVQKRRQFIENEADYLKSLRYRAVRTDLVRDLTILFEPPSRPKFIIPAEVDLMASDEEILLDIKELRKALSVTPEKPPVRRTRSPIAGLRWLATERLRLREFSHAYVNRLCEDKRKSITSRGVEVVPYWDDPVARSNSRKKFEARGGHLHGDLWRQRGTGVEVCTRLCLCGGPIKVTAPAI